MVFQVKRSSKVEQASNVFDGNSNAVSTDPPPETEASKAKGALEEAAKSNEIESQDVKEAPSNDVPEDFMKVVNLNGETMDWPMEFVQYTTTTPSIAFGRNPFLETFDISELDKQASDDSEMKEAKKSQQFLPRSLKLKSAAAENQGTKSNDESAVIVESCELKKQRKKKKKSKRKKKKKNKDGKAIEEGEIDGKDVPKAGEGVDVEETEESKKKKKKRKKKEKGKKRKSKSKTEEAEAKDDTNKDTKVTDQKGKHKKHKKRKHKEKKMKSEEKASEKKNEEKETLVPKSGENAEEEGAIVDTACNVDTTSTPVNQPPTNPSSGSSCPAASDSATANPEPNPKGKKHAKRQREQSANNTAQSADHKETNQTPVSSKRRRRHSSKRDSNEADLNTTKEEASSSVKKNPKTSSSVLTRKSAPGALISGHSLVAYSSDEDSTSQPKEEIDDSDRKVPSNFLKEKEIKAEPHLSWDTPERDNKDNEHARTEALPKPSSGGKWNRDTTQAIPEVKCTGKSSWDTSDSEVEVPPRIPGPSAVNAPSTVSPKVEKTEPVKSSDNPSASNIKTEEKNNDNEAGRRRRKRRRSTRSSDSSRESRSSDDSYSRSRTRSRSHRRRHRRRGGRGRGRRSSRYRRRSRSTSYSSYSSRSSRSPSSRSWSRSYSRSSRSYSSYTSSSSYSRSGRSRSRSRSSYSSYSSRSYYSSRSRTRSRSSSYRHSSARGRSRRRRYSSKSSPDPRYSTVLSNRRIRQGPNRQVSSAANASVSVGKSGDIADGASQQKQLLTRLRRARDSATSHAISSNANAVTAAVANSTPNNNSDGVDADDDNDKPVFGPHLPDACAKAGNDNDGSLGDGKNDSGDSSGAQPSLDIPLPKDRPKLQKPGPGEWCPAMDFGGPPKKKKKMAKTPNQPSGSNGGGNPSSGAQDIPLPGGPTYIGPQVPVTMAKSLGLDISGVDNKQSTKPQYTSVTSTCTTTSTKNSKKSAAPLTSTANDSSAVKTTMEDSFFIPPDQAEQYKGSSLLFNIYISPKNIVYSNYEYEPSQLSNTLTKIVEVAMLVNLSCIYYVSISFLFSCFSSPFKL